MLCVDVTAGEREPVGEQVSRVLGVCIGTQVSFGALGCQDNTFGPCSLVWQLKTHKHTCPHIQTDLNPSAPDQTLFSVALCPKLTDC